MKCREYEVLISTYVDGMISPQEEALVMRHLESCPNCRAYYETLVHMVSGCRQIEEVALPKDFHQRLMKRLEQEETTKIIVQDAKKDKARGISIKKHWKWQYSGGLVAALLVGGVFLYQLNQSGLLLQPDLAKESYELEHAMIEEKVAEQSVEKSSISESAAEQNTRTRSMVDSENNIVQDTQDNENNDLVSCEISVVDQGKFEKQLELFLEQEQIAYEKTDSGYRITEKFKRQELINWIQENSRLMKWQTSEHDGLESEKLELYLKVI